jgi:hypothetical protein
MLAQSGLQLQKDRLTSALSHYERHFTSNRCPEPFTQTLGQSTNRHNGSELTISRRSFFIAWVSRVIGLFPAFTEET